MKNQHPLVQILVRAIWIYLGILIFFILITKPQGYTFTSDPIRGYINCVIISAIVQLFKKNKPSQAKSKLYLDTVAELLQGDRAAAIRLFNYNKQKFGGKTDDWLWQKVIRDIERDRR